MDQRLSLVTLGVSDLARAKAFYDGLGWSGQEVEETVFYQAGGMVVVLWSRAKLAADNGLEDGAHDGFGGIGLAQNVGSRADVDRILADAERAGAMITKPAAVTFYGGYAGVFTDPDGYPWEIAHNPGFTLADDGTITVPDFSAEPPQTR